MSKINHIFASVCRGAVADMRQAGMSDTTIACVVTEIRSAAIHEERLRLSTLLALNPPTHLSHTDMSEVLNT